MSTNTDTEGYLTGSRVFISCGQRPDTDEVATARQIADSLEALGYVPYVAVTQQSLLAIRENVFPALRDAEYFLFLDFKRELLDGGECRGSLFSHQELAIASYLEKDLIAFQEVGIRRLDGLIGHLQANAISFSDRSALASDVLNAVEQRGWTPTWRNEFVLELDSPLYDDSPRGNENGPLGRYFHLRVTNKHRWRVATNCYAFLYSAVRFSNGLAESFGTVEFKWAGSTLPAVRIGPGSFRVLDAFWLDHNDPLYPQFNCFADSGRYIPQFCGPGTWLLSFGVVSDTLPAVTRSFKLTISEDLNSANLETVD